MSAAAACDRAPIWRPSARPYKHRATRRLACGATRVSLGVLCTATIISPDCVLSARTQPSIARPAGWHQRCRPRGQVRARPFIRAALMQADCKLAEQDLLASISRLGYPASIFPGDEEVCSCRQPPALACRHT